MTERPQLEVIERLQHVFAAGKTRALGWRLAQLAGLRRMLVEREEELGAAVKETLGRSAFGTWLTETGFVLSEIEFVSRRLPRWLQPRKVRTVPASRPGRSYVMREPYGVALVISPWNFPLQLALSPLIGAVSAGNCVLIKPSEAAPAVSALLARLLPEYLDADAVAVIEGDATATQALLRGPVDCVHFTGSRTVGRKVMAAAAEKPVPVILELGGKCPCIIHDSADLKLAARRIAWGKFLNAGIGSGIFG
jgi:aldehyde dehydrogenase (NAD+)